MTYGQQPFWQYKIGSKDNLSTVLYRCGVRGSKNLYGSGGWLEKNKSLNSQIINWTKLKIGTYLKLALPASLSQETCILEPYTTEKNRNVLNIEEDLPSNKSATQPPVKESVISISGKKTSHYKTGFEIASGYRFTGINEDASKEKTKVWGISDLPSFETSFSVRDEKELPLFSTDLFLGMPARLKGINLPYSYSINADFYLSALGITTQVRSYVGLGYEDFSSVTPDLESQEDFLPFTLRRFTSASMRFGLVKKDQWSWAAGLLMVPSACSEVKNDKSDLKGYGAWFTLGYNFDRFFYVKTDGEFSYLHGSGTWLRYSSKILFGMELF